MSTGTISKEAPSKRRSIPALLQTRQQRNDDPLPPLTLMSTASAERVREVAQLTNKIRKQKGLRPVTWSNGLYKAADFHADDMAKKRYLAHNSANGTIWWKRIKKFYREPAGENIARGFSSPEAVVKAWMNSPLHRKNILNSKFRTIGVAFNTNGDYWVQDFGY